MTGLYAHKLQVQAFQAWRIPTADKPECEHAYPIDVTGAETIDEALALALPGLQHKDTLAILQTHAGRHRNTLWLYQIKREATRQFRRDPVTGATNWSQRLKQALIMRLPVAEFCPVEPWKWAPDADVIGLDRSLVEHRS